MINLLLPDQIKELELLESAIALMPDAGSAARVIVDRISEILGVPTALLERRRSDSSVIAARDDVAPATIDALFRALDADADPGEGAASGARTVRRVAVGESAWTCLSVAISVRRPRWLALAGDWTLSTPMLIETGRRLRGALAAAARRQSAAARRNWLLNLTARRLTRASDPARVHQIIADACARLVEADLASIALYNSEARTLMIAATHGYPHVLVRHRRIAPGEGIIGSVFRSGRPLRVTDIGRFDEVLRPRLRYRTRSFLAVPIHGSGGVIGVISASDRRDPAEFSLEDLAALRALASTAALALDREAARQLAAEREHDAATDAGTGLLSRRHFFARLEEEVQRARRDSTPLTMIMVDIDNFKELNDRFGHPAGDALLRAAGDVLRRSVRLFDVCARYGGDEFVILMTGGTPESTAKVESRIREGLEACRVTGGPSLSDWRLTASLGIVTALPRSGDELLSLADQALYASKRARGNPGRGGGPHGSRL